jgi:chromosome segregation ATPase
MSRTAIFANAFNDIIQKARKEADAQKSTIEKQLGQAREQLDDAQKRVAELEQQLADIDDELAVGLVAAARDAGIKVDLKRAVAAVNPQSSAADSGASSKKSKPDTAREKAAVMALLQKQHGRWLASTEIKETTGVERPVSVLLKGETRVESQGKGRGVQYRLSPN